MRMALREIRASWQRLLFFFVCIAIGVGSIVALRSVIQNVRAPLTREARALMAADVIVASNRPWTDRVTGVVDAERRAGRIEVLLETIETPTMVRPADRSKNVTKMVELRAVQPAFPPAHRHSGVRDPRRRRVRTRPTAWRVHAGPARVHRSRRFALDGSADTREPVIARIADEGARGRGPAAGHEAA
jgi:predicted lysophospholipase L1 biosynthesis ABC-type transport system permease subunit